jgi:cytochrome c-type biogenesis protein CcmH
MARISAALSSPRRLAAWICGRGRATAALPPRRHPDRGRFLADEGSAVRPPSRALNYWAQIRRPNLGSSLAAVFVAIVIIAVPLLAQQTERAKALSMRMMCVCGCNQILGVCNHVGCTYSHDMLKEIDTRMARNESDDLTIQAFVQEYGAAVMLLPEARGFNLWVWIMPVLAVIGGIFVVRVILVRWRREAVHAGPAPPVSPELLARARREMGPDE